MTRKKAISYIIVIVFLIVTEVPVYYIVLTAFRPSEEIYKTDISWAPTKLTMKNFRTIFGYAFEAQYSFVAYVRNSLFISTISTLLIVSMGALSAYCFSKFQFKWNVVLLLLILVSRLIPPISLVVPFFKVATGLRIVDTWTALILTNIYMYLPFSVWLLKGFFDTIPKDLVDSAKIDGCTNFGAFWRVMFPIAGPGVAAAAILAFLFSWNEFLFPLILTSTEAAKTIPVGLYDFVGDQYVDYGSMAAATIVASLPAVVFVTFFSRYIVSGLLAGAVKH
ncbi:MAG: carbohydrate ABC transporter permease [Deltaproteobacteria bacterium]|nr:carbohydrate ABC transporter permease [Deltaproteobacteria bacterium]